MPPPGYVILCTNEGSQKLSPPDFRIDPTKWKKEEPPEVQGPGFKASPSRWTWNRE